jgi:hypothetical protein
MVYLANSDRPLWVGSSLWDNHDFVSLNVGYRPIAVVQQARKTRHVAGFTLTIIVLLFVFKIHAIFFVSIFVKLLDYGSNFLWPSLRNPRRLNIGIALINHFFG